MWKFVAKVQSSAKQMVLRLAYSASCAAVDFVNNTVTKSLSTILIWEKSPNPE